MRLAAAFAAHELRTQGRSLRFRVLAALYMALGSVPAALIWLRREQALSVVGSATYAAETMEILPLLTAVAAFLISLDAITREQDEGAWSTVSLAGMSNAGYLLRRWLALQPLLLPLTALPVAAAAALAGAANGPETLYVSSFAVPWLLHVVPIALTFSALAVAVGTIAGGAINAFLLAAFVLLFLPTLANALLGRFGIRLGAPLEWLDTAFLPRSLSRMAGDIKHDTFLSPPFPLEVSELPFDARAVAGQLLARAAVPVALAAALLGLAVRYLRRTRPDVRPWRIRQDHPLRTFLVTFARLRERYTPDPRPARADLLAVSALLLLAAGASALVIGRTRHFEALGRARFAAESSQAPAPTPGDLSPGRWRVEGKLGPGRRVDLTVTAEMRNLGPAPHGHLAFELNPSIGIVEARAGEGTLTLSRDWDRLAVDLAPPIPPGGRREIRFRLTGAPAEARFSPQLFDYPSFHKRFGDHLHPRFFRELLDLSTSYEAPALSARRIRLVTSDLSPIPRYQAWKLDDQLNVLADSFTPEADVAISLTGPPGLLADSCGDTTRSGRLAGGCRIPLAELAVVGGRYVTLPSGENGTAVAVYPAHARIGALHLGFLDGSARKVEEAWPGLDSLRRMAVLEWSGNRVFDPDPVGVALSTRWRGPNDLAFTVLGNLVLLSEEDLIQKSKVLKPESFLAEMVAAQLTRRRSLVPEDSVLFRLLFRNLALQRLGLGPESGAVVTGLRPGQGGMIRVPPPEDFYSPLYWHNRFPALLAGLRHLMGEEALRQAIEELLSRGGVQRPCSRQELLKVLARHGGPDLARFLEDNLVKGGMAEPVLEGVEFRQTPEGWHATGRMHNRGDAEALCKVVLTTDLGPVATLARAGGGQDGAFDLRTTRRPQAVLLDPDKECHRLMPNGAPGDRIFFQGGK